MDNRLFGLDSDDNVYQAIGNKFRGNGKIVDITDKVITEVYEYLGDNVTDVTDVNDLLASSKFICDLTDTNNLNPKLAEFDSDDVYTHSLCQKNIHIDFKRFGSYSEIKYDNEVFVGQQGLVQFMSLVYKDYEGQEYFIRLIDLEIEKYCLACGYTSPLFGVSEIEIGDEVNEVS